MKKILSLSIVCAIALFIASCSGGSEPKDVAKKYMAAVQKGDYKTALECVDFGEDAEKAEKAREQYLSLIEEKVKDGIPEEKKIADFEVLSQEIDEDAGTAVVIVSVTKGEGPAADTKINMVKTADGKWMLKDAK